MTGQHAAETGRAEELAELHDPLASSFPPSLTGRFLFWLAVVFSLYQIAIAAHVIDLPSQVMRAVHVGFLLALGYPLLALGRGFGTPLRALCWLFAAAGVAVAAYQWIEYTPLLFRAGDPNLPDLVFGCVAVVTVFVAAWMLMGPALPIICGLFLAYALFGQHLPPPFDHRGYAFEQVVEQIAYGTEGI